MPGVLPVRHVIFGCGLLFSACGPEMEGPAPWDVTFACAAQAVQSELVQVAISRGSCASPEAPLYSANVERGQTSRSAAPPDLPAGSYAFSATAYNSRGTVVTTTCLNVALPTSRSVAMVLPGPPGCKPFARDPDAGRPLTHPIADPSDAPDAAIAVTDAGAHETDASVPTSDASVPTTDAGRPGEPITDAGGGPCDGSCQTAVFSFPTRDISLPKPCWSPGEFMPVTIHLPVTAKDWLWVKDHPDYGGSDREFWDHTGITTAGAVYRGGMREPLGLHAPTIPGSFKITWHPADASDKEVRSTLNFTVSSSCL